MNATNPETITPELVKQMASDILAGSEDGSLLDPDDLQMTEWAVNGMLLISSLVYFCNMHRDVISGTYRKKWLHGIEHLTLGHDGAVFWKGSQVEFFSITWARSAAGYMAARNLAVRCIAIEEMGGSPDVVSCIFDWHNGPDVLQGVFI